MKPRLEPAPLTAEDRDIWVCVGLWRCFVLNDALEMVSAIGDRRDADRMLRIMTRGCRFCGSNSMYGEIHEMDCIYVIEPSARRVWLRNRARIIEWKPHLQPAEHTDEDSLAWADVLLRYAERHGGSLWTRSLMADRRDGNMMWYAQLIAKWGPAAINLEGIDFRGWTQE